MTDNKKSFCITLSLIALGVILSAICYYWIDKPLALWANAEHFSSKDSWLRFLTYIKTPIFSGVLLIYIICILRAYLFARLTKGDRDALFIGNSVVFSYLLQNKLHNIFGRDWPNTWVHHNPSLLGTGDYGFHFFHSGDAFESFPSGHTTVVVALCAAIWVLYPKLRILSVLGISSIVIGLVGMDYHFVGDCVAGFFIAVTTVNILTYLRTLP
ncbi:phosphatase PAP2 family protein [Legionella fallonii]|uniref:Putative Phosphoesterase, PAP2 family n=1 Tax=Legionella fallonii LLAP-10 TaxID=1212491 RepID=A0A098G5H0_9GAMM|nr:phosphatase PAP2 family protein [Legionella fallonii]CEG57743.1 putative Phosphoesterase, PAP2 family [Legionella fallonii LLAP-10]